MLYSSLLTLVTIVSGHIIGVAPENQHLYNIANDGTWRCLLDPSIVLLANQINDNFCDCPDGSDEPGTNACEFTDEAPKYFYCANDGYFPKYIENYKVNDGVCDYDICCDGSDEYVSGHCENKCGEVMEQYRNYLKKTKLAVSNALRAQEELVVQAKVAKLALAEKVAKLKNDLEKRQGELESLRGQLKEAESNDESIDHSENGIADTLLLEISHYVQEVESQFSRASAFSSSYRERIAHLEGLLADLVQNYNPNFNDLSVKQCVKLFEEYISNKPQEAEVQPSLEKFKEGIASFAAKLKSYVPASTPNIAIVPNLSNILHSYYGRLISSFKPEHAIEEHPAQPDQPDQPKQPNQRRMSESASKIREKFESAEKDVNSKRAEYSIHEENLHKSYGPKDILRAVEGKWVNKKIGQYTYKLGFMDAIYQDDTLVGRFAKFDGTSLHFMQGSKCWNGPQRSAVVELVCGPVSDLISVSEPEKCHYKFILQSPIVCADLSLEEIGRQFKVDVAGFK